MNVNKYFKLSLMSIMLSGFLTGCMGLDEEQGTDPASEGSEQRQDEGSGGLDDLDDDLGDGFDDDDFDMSELFVKGAQRAKETTTALMTSDSYVGLLNGIELAVVYDANHQAFLGYIHNTTDKPICAVDVQVMAGGKTLSGEDSKLEGIEPYDIEYIELSAKDLTVAGWTASIDSFDCKDDFRDSDMGGQYQDEEFKDEFAEFDVAEGKAKDGADGKEDESGNFGDFVKVSSPSTAVNDTFTGTLNGLDFSVSYDAASSSFKGTVENKTPSRICFASAEISTTANSKQTALEGLSLNLEAGEKVNIVSSMPSVTVETWLLNSYVAKCSRVAGI